MKRRLLELALFLLPLAGAVGAGAAARPFSRLWGRDPIFRALTVFFAVLGAAFAWLFAMEVSLTFFDRPWPAGRAARALFFRGAVVGAIWYVCWALYRRRE